MYISYEDYEKLLLYEEQNKINILDDESILENEEELRKIISSVKLEEDKDPTEEQEEYIDEKIVIETDKNREIKEKTACNSLKKSIISLISENMESYFFILDTLKTFRYNNKDLVTLFKNLNYYNTLYKELPNISIDIEKIKEIYLKYLKTYDNSKDFGIASDTLKNSNDFINISDSDPELKSGITYKAFNKYFIDISNNNNCNILATFVHEMRHFLDTYNYSWNNTNYEFDELRTQLEELYFCDFLEEEFPSDYAKIIKYKNIINLLELILNYINCFNSCNNMLNKNYKIDDYFINQIGNRDDLEEMFYILDSCFSSEIIHSFNAIVALDIYFNNKDKNDGMQIADQYMNGSSYRDINISTISEIFNNVFNELERLKQELDTIDNKTRTRQK